jgi:hypothetical protein
MKTKFFRTMLWLTVPVTVLSFTACGTRTETEKTTIIERKVEVPVSTPAPQEDGHMQRAGEKIDAKVGEKIDDAVDRALD